MREKEWTPSAADWGGDIMVCLLAAPPVELFAGVGKGWPHHVLAAVCICLTPISCHFRDCKALVVIPV